MSTKTKHVEAQTETVPEVTVASIRRDPNFAAGFEDYRGVRLRSIRSIAPHRARPSVRRDDAANPTLEFTRSRRPIPGRFS